MSWEALHVAATDRASGSADVATQAAAAFVEIANTLPSDAITDAARILVQGQPLMASCLKLADAVLKGLDEDGPQGASRAAGTFAGRLATEKTAVAQALRQKLPREGTVLTVSASSTVLEALCAEPRVRVVCAVSDPGGEGLKARDTLREHDVDAVVIPDGAIAQQSTRADAIVFGADVIGPNAILNKTGTLAAALAARASGRACLCAAGTSKLVDEVAWPLLAATAERLTVEGVPAFEEVPGSLVTTTVTEQGATSARALRRATRTARFDPRILEWLTDRTA